MSNNRIWICGGLSLAALGLAQQAAAQRRQAARRCSTHAARAVMNRLWNGRPTRAELAFRPPADIVTALTTGVMAPMAKGLSRPEIEAVALFLAPGQQSGSAGTDPDVRHQRPHQGECLRLAAHSDRMKIPRRFQPNPGFRAADVGKAQSEMGLFHGRRRPTRRRRRLALHHQPRRQILRIGRKDRMRALGASRMPPRAPRRW